MGYSIQPRSGVWKQLGRKVKKYGVSTSTVKLVVGWEKQMVERGGSKKRKRTDNKGH